MKMATGLFHLFSKDDRMSVSLRFGLTPLAMALCLVPMTALAQVIPNSGQILQQVQPKPSEQPRAEPGLQIESRSATVAPDSTPFAVTHLQIDDSTVFDRATLHALVADGEGRTLTLTQLDTLAQRITDYYHVHGYPLARALVPAQTLSNGTVRIVVVEARYDSVRLDNRSRVSDGLLLATLSTLHAGDLVTGDALDRSLLLLDELPGVSASATLSPGVNVGTSTLSVMAAPTPTVQGTLLADNAGSRYTGRWRAGGNLDINNPLHHGDQLSISAFTSGRGMRYGRLAYQYTLNGQGTRLGAAYSALAYKLGSSLNALDAHGTARIASAWLAQPLLRSRNASVDVRLQFDHKRLRDRIDATALRNDRHTGNWTASIFAQHRDDLGLGGLTSANLDINYGQLNFERSATAAAAADAATARTQGSYVYWAAGISRLQSLTTGLRLYASVRGQQSNHNLDSSEQFILGGPGSVRGYEVASVAGASGWLGTLELRHDVNRGCPGRCEASVFVDDGQLRINASPWMAGTNRAHLRSAGIGFQWQGTSAWQIQAQLAAPLGATPSMVDERRGARVWVQALRGF